MEERLKSCPFCGSNNVLTHQAYRDFYVKCGNCETFGPLSCNEKEAVKNWNTRLPAPIDGGGLDWEKEFDDLIGSMYLTDSSGKNPLAFKEWWIYPDVKKFIRNLLSNRGGGLDEKIIRGYLAELAGSASLCWEPKPTGVFDSTQAMKFVDVAVDRIMKLGTPPTKGVNIENIRNAVGSAVLDWEVNEVEVKTRKKKENTKNLVDVVTDSVYAELCGKDNLISNDGVTPTQKGE